MKTAILGSGAPTKKVGLIESYVHAGGEVGVLVEVTCETKDVTRQETFKAFCRDIALQIAATDPRCISPYDIAYDPELKDQKIYAAVCLLDQPFLKEPDKTVQEILNETIAKTGEQIEIRRFTRYHLEA